MTMDLDELLQAHQAEVLKARNSGNGGVNGGVTDSHFEQVALYAERIRELRQLRLGEQERTAPAGSRPSVMATVSTDAVIYGTYLGNPAPQPASVPLDSWESEGGSLDPPQVPLPNGVTTDIIRQFYVGPYVYTDLALALAEHHRQQSHTQADSVATTPRGTRPD
ncbi:MAG: hypothetical protein ACR2PC_00675 [Tsuneonella suprasediminis]|nr:hypothetical protein LBX01_02365 [Altererythrobacter sp. N1]